MLEPGVGLASPAGSMPGKLVTVVVLMIISIVLNLLTLSFFSAALGTALVVGLFVGNDGVRRFVVGLMWVNLAVSIGFFVLALSLNGATVLSSVLSVGIAGFVVWALVQDDVRDWMFKTAFKDGL